MKRTVLSGISAILLSVASLQAIGMPQVSKLNLGYRGAYVIEIELSQADSDIVGRVRQCGFHRLTEDQQESTTFRLMQDTLEDAREVFENRALVASKILPYPLHSGIFPFLSVTMDDGYVVDASRPLIFVDDRKSDLISKVVSLGRKSAYEWCGPISS